MQDLFPTRLQKTSRAWYMHTRLFTEKLLPLGDRYKAVRGVCQPSLFWGLKAFPTMDLLVQLDRQAVKLERMTAGLWRKDEQTNADFHKSSATLRLVLTFGKFLGMTSNGAKPFCSSNQP
eukprot:4273009-Amphidinium_carterae.1